jgi:hypothetical protein
MGLVDRLQSNGISNATLSLAVKETHSVLDFYLKSAELDLYLKSKGLQEYEGSFLHGPVTPTQNPGSDNPVYEPLVRKLVSERYMPISEADAKKIIHGAQKKIDELEAANIAVPKKNKKRFYLPKPKQ